MKKVFILFLSAVLFFCFTSCSGKSEYVLTSGNLKVSSGVYAYYLDKVMSSAEEYGAQSTNKESIQSAAIKLCENYIATLSLFSKNEVDFSQQYKSQVAEETEEVWSLFGNYYKSIGIEKTDMNIIKTVEAKKDCLLQFYYGKGGKNEVSDDKLKEKFVEMYIGFKAFEGTFTKTNVKGESVEMTESEKEALISQFRKMATKINEGESIDDVYEEYCASNGLVATTALEVMLTKENDPMYADDFFKKLKTISHGKAAPVTSGTSVYVAQRCTIASSDEDVFEQYRSVVLEEMKMSDVEKKISKERETLSFETDEKLLNRIYKEVEKLHS